MFILGLLSFFQMAFIPGYLFLQLIKFEVKGKIQTIVYSFSLSVLLNYLMVYLLTALKLYTPFTLYIILLVEGVLLFYLFEFKRPLFQISYEKSKDSLKSHFLNRPVYSFFFLLSLVIFYIYFSYFFSSIGSIFRTWDPVVSWNRWAVDWSGNHFPLHTWHYPQLIPANWSMTYVIMKNSTVQFFAKPLMALFPIMTLLLFFDLAIKKRDFTYLVGLFLYGNILLHYYRRAVIISGHVDIAVSFFAFLTLYTIFVGKKENKFSVKAIFLVNVFAAAAAVTKQAGIFIFILVISWDIYILYRHSVQLPRKKRIPVFLMLLLMNFLIVSGYLVKEVQISKGKDRSEVAFVTKRIHRGRTVLQRLEKSLGLLIKKSAAERAFFFLCLFLLIFSLFQKKSRLVSMVIVSPFFLIWGIYYGYGLTNFTLAFPFIAYSSAFGFGLIWDKVKGFLLLIANREKFNEKILYFSIFILVVMLPFLLSLTIFSQSKLVEYQEKAKAAERSANSIQSSKTSTYKLLNFLSVKVKIPGFKKFKVWYPLKKNQEKISPFLVTFTMQGKFKFDFTKDHRINVLTVRNIEPNKDGITKIHFGYEVNRRGFNMEMPESKYIHLVVNAAVSLPLIKSKRNFVFISDFLGGWESNKTFFSSPGWQTYIVSRKVRPGAARLVLGFRFTPGSEEDRLKIRNIHIFVSDEPL